MPFAYHYCTPNMSKHFYTWGKTLVFELFEVGQKGASLEILSVVGQKY